MNKVLLALLCLSLAANVAQASRHLVISATPIASYSYEAEADTLPAKVENIDGLLKKINAEDANDR